MPAFVAKISDATCSALPTPVFFYGLEPGEEISVDIEKGKTLIIRFLTTDDFPPFNFLNDRGQLTGFNVDLARAICAELNAPCTIQARAGATRLASNEPVSTIVHSNTDKVPSTRGRCQRHNRRTTGASIRLSNNASRNGTINTEATAQA